MQIWVKFGEGMSKHWWIMCENVLIWLKHEYRRLTLSSCCDVISDVINMKMLFLWQIEYVLPISDDKLELSIIFQKFEKWRNFELAANVSFWAFDRRSIWLCKIWAISKIENFWQVIEWSKNILVPLIFGCKLRIWNQTYGSSLLSCFGKKYPKFRNDQFFDTK